MREDLLHGFPVKGTFEEGVLQQLSWSRPFVGIHLQTPIFFQLLSCVWMMRWVCGANVLAY